MKHIAFICIVLCRVTGYVHAQHVENAADNTPVSETKEMTFYSSEELNRYRFGQTDLNRVTTGYLLDMEEEWSNEQVDSFLLLLNEPLTDVNRLLTTLNCLERTDVNFRFERDSLLFPVMDHYFSAYTDRKLLVPLFIIDAEMSRLGSQRRKALDNWTGTEPYPAFSENDLRKETIFCTSFFGDTIRNEQIHLYWDSETVYSNTGKTVASVQLTIGNETRELAMGEHLDLSAILANGALDQIGIAVTFSDGTIQHRNCRIHLTKKPDKKVSDFTEKSYDVHQGHFGSGTFGTHTLYYTVYYGCGQEGLNKPFIMVAGWGPYVSNPGLGPIINSFQGWPTAEPQLYEQWNQANVITELREAGFDVIIVRFTPPNASIRSNVDKLKLLINWVNEQKELVGSNEENIVLGYSAGAMCVRLTLQEMEKEHLEENGPHPHTKLYISFDGEHQGAHIPLAVQHAAKYLNSYQGGLTGYTLNYILNAPLSKQLLHYFHSKTGNAANPGQGWDDARSHLIWWHDQANHSKSVENPNDPFSRHNPGYPAFSRNISISNGMNESRYTSTGTDHFPYPSNYGHVLFEQNNNNRKWKAEFNIPGGNRVFYYQTKPWVGTNWTLVIDAVTSQNSLLLDNAPGGMVFISDNPLTHVIHQMKKQIWIGDPSTYNPHTQFCFTPTVFTHDIRGFTPTNGKMEYNMKSNNLMFQNKTDYDFHIENPNEQPNYSNYFGYPHIAYPYSHYWEVTPFDAVFSANTNSEHILFNGCTRSNPNNHNEEWTREETSSVVQDLKTVVKHFIKGEADCRNAYIQNKRYGWNAREDGVYRYKADIITLDSILVGKEVTQRTDFNSTEFLSNSDTRMRAEKAIVFKPGTHIHAGATLHAKIEPYHCVTYNGMTTSSFNHTAQEAENIQEYDQFEQRKAEIGDFFVIFPNPSAGKVTVKNTENKPYAYAIYDFSGQLLHSGESESEVTFNLKKGMYIIKTQCDENMETHKIVVH